jgi:cobalt-zinc-cadmium efflux system membrane fusion protein
MKNKLIITLLLGLIMACKPSTKPKDIAEKEIINTVKLNDTQLKNAQINIGKLEQKTITNKLKVNGQISVPVQNAISVSAPLGGYLKSTTLTEGKQVRKGEIIAILEDQQYIQIQQDYLSAKAQFSGIEKEYFRQKTLNSNKATSDKVFENTEANYLSQKILIKSLSEKLKLIQVNPEQLNENNLSRNINIYSPINGFVRSVNTRIGRYVSPTEVLFELTNPNDLFLSLTVFEKDINKLSVGQSVIAYSNQSSDGKHAGKIQIIGKDISPERSLKVHCTFDKKDQTLIPGLYMNAEIEVAGSLEYVIPSDAIVKHEGKEYVFIQSEINTFQMVQVNIGNSYNGLTQINFSQSEHIKIAEQDFVTKGAYTLLMQLKNMGEE